MPDIDHVQRGSEQLQCRTVSKNTDVNGLIFPYRHDEIMSTNKHLNGSDTDQFPDLFLLDVNVFFSKIVRRLLYLL
jgi:hypothetical protein